MTSDIHKGGTSAEEEKATASNAASSNSRFSGVASSGLHPGKVRYALTRTACAPAAYGSPTSHNGLSVTWSDHLAGWPLTRTQAAREWAGRIEKGCACVGGGAAWVCVWV